MDRIIPRYARVPLLFCAVAQFLAYYLPRALPRLPYVVDMATKLDRLITVTPAWILVYVAAYLYWVYGYVAIARVSPDVCRRFCRADYIGKAVAFVCFVLLPTCLPRSEVEGGGAFGWMLRAIYAADAPDNLFPSLHCSVSWLVARFMGTLPAFSTGVKIASFLFAILVCVSTLFTGQHVIADAIGGILLAEGAIYLSGKVTKHETQV
jgi:membrane-associated phospholipid phosphatase